MTVDLEMAARFLSVVAPNDDQLIFQTFPDSSECFSKKGLVKVLCGSLDEHAGVLTRLNNEGASINVMVNRGNGRERRKAVDVVEVRALFIDLDGAPLGPVEDSPLQPSVVVSTSPGKYHAYWPTSGIGRDAFRAAQKALIRRFGSDPAIHDLSRVMRLPGFYHRKSTPFLTRIVKCEHGQTFTSADLAPLIEAHSIADSVGEPFKQSVAIRNGKRNSTLFQLGVGLKNQGVSFQDGQNRLAKINAERCEVPLSGDEVTRLAKSVWSKPASGFLALPYEVFDHPEFIGLPGAAQQILLFAYRKVHHQGNGNITLTTSEMAGRLSEGSVKNGRELLLKTPFLELVKPHVSGIKGQRRQPARYRLPYVIRGNN